MEQKILSTKVNICCVTSSVDVKHSSYLKGNERWFVMELHTSDPVCFHVPL